MSLHRSTDPSIYLSIYLSFCFNIDRLIDRYIYIYLNQKLCIYIIYSYFLYLYFKLNLDIVIDIDIKMFYQVDNIRPSITVQPSNSVRISNSVPFGTQFGTLNCGRNGTELHRLLQIIHPLCHGTKVLER